MDPIEKQGEKGPEKLSKEDILNFDAIKDAETRQEKDRVAGSAGGKLGLMKKIVAVKPDTINRADKIKEIYRTVDANATEPAEGNDAADASENDESGRTGREHNEREERALWKTIRKWLAGFFGIKLAKDSLDDKDDEDDEEDEKDHKKISVKDEHDTVAEAHVEDDAETRDVKDDRIKIDPKKKEEEEGVIAEGITADATDDSSAKDGDVIPAATQSDKNRAEEHLETGADMKTPA